MSRSKFVTLGFITKKISEDLNLEPEIVKRIFEIYAQIVEEYSKKKYKIALPYIGQFKPSKHTWTAGAFKGMTEISLRFSIDKSVKFLD